MAPIYPLVVSGTGRSGSTALMALLGTDPSVAFDRHYPFENRCLSYVLKLGLVAARTGPGFDQKDLVDFDNSLFGPMPWPEPSTLMPTQGEWLANQWRLLAESVRRQSPAHRWYAEKCSHWMPALLRSITAARTIHLVRDPRDVWLSMLDFSRERKTTGFGVELGELDRARYVAHQWLSFAENERADEHARDAIRVIYEDFVTDLHAVTSRLNAWLGLSMDPDHGDFTKHVGRHATSSSVTASVARWERAVLPATVSKILLSPLIPELKRYGYVAPPIEEAPRLVPELGWSRSDDAYWIQGEEGLVATPVGSDAWFECPTESFPAHDVSEMWVCVSGGTGDHFSVYWRGPGETFDEVRSLRVGFHPGPHRQIVRLPVGSHEHWQGTIEQLRIDVFNGRIAANGAGKIHWLQRVP